MLNGETIATGAAPVCPDCGVKLEYEVLKTCAYYVGTRCNCGPYSRDSGYYKTRAEAQAALDNGDFGR